MSDMTRAVIQMPYALAMEGEISRQQFYNRALSLLADHDALAADNQRLREALTGAGIWIKDVTNVVLFPLANEVQGGLGAEADSFGGCTPELLRGIDAALTTANGEGE
jgi:hypothetical protein